MTAAFVNPSWMPHSVGEAARAGDATVDDLLSGRAWSHLLDGLRQASAVVLSGDIPRNADDMAAGFRHLLVLLGIGLDNALREGSGSVLAVKPSGVDAIYKWGMDCPDCIYTGAGLRGGETYRLRGNGSARYVGLQSMAGMASSANLLLDELDLGPGGEVDLILSAASHEGNWLPIAENATALVVRHFFYDWDTEVASSLTIERIGAAREKEAGPVEDPRAVVARQLIALQGTSWSPTSISSSSSARPETPNTFLPPLDGTAMGAAAENRPVIGSWQIEPDEALLIEVSPPEGLYWSFSLGNPWWETIDYGSHQSSINGHQAVVDDDGVMRAVVAHDDPGVANWLDTAGHSAGPIILRCVRTETAPIPLHRVIKFSDVAQSVPAGSRRVTPEERRATLAARRLAVSKRFCR